MSLCFGVSGGRLQEGLPQDTTTARTATIVVQGIIVILLMKQYGSRGGFKMLAIEFTNPFLSSLSLPKSPGEWNNTGRWMNLI